MKIAVIGAGAVGGLLAARLAESGHQVSIVARGRTLDAVKANGLTIISASGRHSIELAAESDSRRLGIQDIVIIAVKTNALHDVASRIAPLLGDDTAVVCAMNGVPWWFFADAAVPHAGLHLKSVDPHGLLMRAIPAWRSIGCVVHLSSSSPAPGVIQPGLGNRLILGEALGGMSDRLESIVALLCDVGFDASSSAAIREDIWYKLWGNLTLNPLSAMTGATCDQLLDDPLVKSFCINVMQEAAAIGEKIACPIGQNSEERIALTRQLGAFKTSMLQDAESGKPLEIDALVGAVHEIGEHLGIETPHISNLLGMVRVFARCRGLG